MAPFSKPETVLKQAEGLISVGQTHAALQSLSEMFSSKRFRSTPLASLEPIMLRFIELCVEMRKGRTAKEGLMQYKNIAQNSSVSSVEVVVNKFVALGEAKVKEAQEKAKAVEKEKAGDGGVVDVDDLEASETPESILLGAVSGDQSKDRTDRALVTPWLKFLWESYRTSLETLKNNARLEVIYQQIAQQAFKFCLKHQRKVEFRRLCETLRLHLSNVAKYSHQPHSINLSDPETLQHHLDTRFAQLNTSVELELWQEAFRSVEDVHNLLTLAKKAPRPAMMANYYEKCTKIFLMSGNALFHAAAWSRYYGVVISMGGRTDEELAKLAGQVLVSALAVPAGSSSVESEEEVVKGKNSRLTALLGLTKMPTRAGLIRDALSRNVLKLSPPTVKALYDLLEVKFDPLTLCVSIAPLFKSLSNSEPLESAPSTSDLSQPAINYAPYLPLLHQALLSRLLSHLSQVYSSIKVSKLLQLVAPIKVAGVEGAYDDSQIQAYVMGCARRGELNVRVDHAEGCILFIDEPFASVNASAEEHGHILRNSKAKDAAIIQAPLAELVRTRLGNVAKSLHDSLQAIDGHPPKPSPEEQKQKLDDLVAAVEAERKALAIRRALVAKRRELLSELNIKKEQEESIRKAEVSRFEKEKEQKRLQEESRQREMERIKRERESIQNTEAKKYAQSLLEMGVVKPEDAPKMEGLGTHDLLSIQVQHLEKEKKETSQRLRIVGKRMDHLERAYRKEERPLLAQDYEMQQKHDFDTFSGLQQTRNEEAKRAYQDDLATKTRLSRMMQDFETRKDIIIRRRGEEFAKKKDAASKKIAEEKAKRKKAFLAAKEEERKKQEEVARKEREKREEEERLEAERQAEEERIRAEQEAEERAAEEKKRQEEEAATAVRKQREAEREAAREQALLQQRREEEAEQRRLQRAAERKRETQSTAAPPSRLNGSTSTQSVSSEGGSVWRRRAAGTEQTPNNSQPTTPVRQTGFASSQTQPRSESPAPARYRPPGSLGGAGAPTPGTWRAKEEARQATVSRSGAATPVRSASPAPPAPKEEQKLDDDGFTTVGGEKKNVWRPRRGGRTGGY